VSLSGASLFGVRAEAPLEVLGMLITYESSGEVRSID
jgi:hypothetical protein